jgi:hypothetical protein
MTRTFIGLLLLAASAFSQNTTSSDSGLVIGGSSSGLSAAYYLTSTGTLTASNWVSGSNWITKETRPLDHKGPSLTQVKLDARLLSSEQLPPRGYYKLAKSIGVIASGDEAALLELIHDHGMKVFNYTSVDAYLYRKALSQGANMHWVWKPIRQADIEKIKASITYQDNPGVGIIFDKAYARELPKRILEEAAAFIDACPDAVFLSSDYENIKPDPFLAVTTPSLLAAGKIWIVDVWAEPGFEDRPVGDMAKAFAFVQ